MWDYFKGPHTSKGFKNEKEESFQQGDFLFLTVWAVWLLLDLSQRCFSEKKLN